MDYGRLGPSDSFRASVEASTSDEPNPSPTPKKKNHKIFILSVASIVLLVACAASAAVLVRINAKHGGVHNGSDHLIHRKPTLAISRACSKTRYPSLCVNSLVDFPGALSAGEADLVHISVNMTLFHVGRAFNSISEITNLEMMQRVRSAYEDCLELLDDSVDHLQRSLFSVTPTDNGDNDGRKVGSVGDVMTWLSAAYTNHDTCTDGFEEVTGIVKDHVNEKISNLSQLVSNSLSIYVSSNGDDNLYDIPVQNRRRRLMGSQANMDFPMWVGRKERRLLDMPISAIQADIIVSKDGGNGAYDSITKAIKAAPQSSSRRTIIYIKAGRYEENFLKVGRKQTNLMFIGDGIGKTIISGGKSVADGLTTFRTATFAATGAGFIARDITFENWAGPSKHQAVALRVGADHSVVYKCQIIGYQDTLYVHSQRQFFRECEIYGTVDFIFGNAAVVLQKCIVYSRKPMAEQKTTVTAQNRKEPDLPTGMSFHNSRILAAPDLEAAKGNISSYLGRPWKLYSRVVYMMCYIGDHINSDGWLPWNGDFALDTLYYGEYMNYGPGGAVGKRVKWPGYRVITSAVEAAKFTVAQFIGSSWLPSTGVAFVSGLST
ncbi:hypothetical protein GIB67_042203 [Kingdonia uniflora]|uniref:Pectinesterase n=1 Tax=Kingdonia uniflora TaxID=39325 RepID=A0A7J7LE23_9MAGN|nr:hypothetical protein GIB67_042203 [Kingdonia uniflora]